MRCAVLLAGLLAGCVSSPPLADGPAAWLPDAREWSKRRPARGCIQAEFRRSTGRYRFTGLHKGGGAVGREMRLLPALTRDYQPAYQLALRALHQEQAAWAPIGLAAGGGALAITGYVLAGVLGGDPATATTLSPWAFIGMGFGATILGVSVMALLHGQADGNYWRSIEAYDRHARLAPAEGCPDPSAVSAPDPGPPPPAPDPFIGPPPPDQRTEAERVDDLLRSTRYLLDLSEQIDRAVARPRPAPP